VLANEAAPDVVQLSGGEPTLHPDFFAILDAARARPIRHLMMNTNGIRIAQDREFAARLAECRQGLEVYLQFDSFRAAALKSLRAAHLTRIHEQAIERLSELDISTTLVVTLKKGVNDDEIRWRSAAQSKAFARSDIIPVPCNPSFIAMKKRESCRSCAQKLWPRRSAGQTLASAPQAIDTPVKAQHLRGPETFQCQSVRSGRRLPALMGESHALELLAFHL
jgi:pyruvate-formate lyase-activating enzyme